MSLDPLVVLEGPEGEVIAENDDGTIGSLNSHLVTTLEQDGTYTVWAGSWLGSSTGQYTLTVEEAASGGDLRSIAIGETKQGYLDRSDPEEPSRNQRAGPVLADCVAGRSARHHDGFWRVRYVSCPRSTLGINPRE
ncbi:MAG: hypothetical protein U5K37_09590 [Natrialbaceae archaeon]|nr:hypothetical protein [Natrialbaceae archaeon]